MLKLFDLWWIWLLYPNSLPSYTLTLGTDEYDFMMLCLAIVFDWCEWEWNKEEPTDEQYQGIREAIAKMWWVVIDYGD